MERRFLGADDQLSIASTSTPGAEFFTLLEDTKRQTMVPVEIVPGLVRLVGTKQGN